MNSVARYHMPAEWEKHEGTWLQWPHNKEYQGHQLQYERMWLMMVDVLRRHENVHIIAVDERHREHIEYQLGYFKIGLENVDLCIIPNNDVWVRDNGPIYVVDERGELAATNWQFNGWGNRFPHELNDRVPAAIAALTSVPLLNPPLVLEGGAVEVNGSGTLLATRSSIINPNRNPSKSQEEIEAMLRQFLGVTHFIWLTGAGGKEIDKWGGVTDSHIDGSARFTDETTVLYNWTDDSSDPRYPMFAQLKHELEEAMTEAGECLTLIPLPVPRNGVYQISENKAWRKAKLTVGTYCNYYVANEVILVPVFGNVNDERAKAIIAEQFPDRKVIGIDAVGLVEEGGAIHCVTQQQPAVTA